MEALSGAEPTEPNVAPSGLSRLKAAVRTELAEARRSFAGIASNRALRRLQLAWAGSVIGQWSYVVGLGVFAYEAGGATGVGLAGVIRTVPSAVGGPFVAALGDRYPRVRVMVASDLVRALMLGAGALAIATDVEPVVVYVLGGLIMLASAAFHPAQAALLPSLTNTPEELTASNLVSSTIESVGFFVGPALGGLLLAVGSPQAVFLAAALGCIWSATLLAGLPSGRPAGGESAEDAGKSFFREVFQGMGVVAREPNVRLLISLFSLQTLVAGALNVLVVVTAFKLLHSGQSGVGWLNAVVGVGGVLGTFAALPLVSRGRLGVGFSAGLLLWGMPIALIGLVTNDPVAFIALALVGVGNTLVDVAGITMLQRAVDDKVLARVMGVLETSLITTIGLGAALAPLLVHLLGARGALIATGAVLPVATALAWPRLRMLERIGGPPIELVELLRSARLFAPLPEATIEHLARRLVRVEQQPGDVVIRQGEPGDRYYLIQSGELDADVDGQHARRMGPGAGFGEIALLRDVPRTATVTAVTECVLYALERDEFIPAVTGSAPATAEADALASARLAAFSPGFLKA